MENNESKVSKARPINKGLMVASLVGIGVGGWSIASGQGTIGAVLIILCTVIIGLQVSRSKAKTKEG